MSLPLSRVAPIARLASCRRSTPSTTQLQTFYMTSFGFDVAVNVESRVCLLCNVKCSINEPRLEQEVLTNMAYQIFRQVMGESPGPCSFTRSGRKREAEICL